MLEDLLINIKYMQIRRNTFNAIRLIDLGINLLQTLVKRLQIGLISLLIVAFALPDVLLPVEKRSRERLALNGPL